MRLSRRVLPWLSLVLLVGACEGPTPTTPAPEQPLFKSLPGQGAGQFATVMTRNLYLGADINDVLNPSTLPAGVPPEYVLPALVWQVHQDVIASRPDQRMAAIAEEIAAARPALVGLQEVETYYTQTPGDFLAGNPVAASTVEYDFLARLLEALAARGADYRVAARNTNVDIEVPALPLPIGSGAPYDLRLVDSDVILARAGVAVSNPRSAAYQALRPVSLGGISFDYLRGWSSVDVKLHGRSFRFFNTHLETQDAASYNVTQAAEIADSVANSPLPVVLVGDFNSDANAAPGDPTYTAAYGDLVAAGLVDLWADTYPGEIGLTCCALKDLSAWSPTEQQRIDLVFSRGFAADGRVWRTDGALIPALGIFPSDHRGVVGEVRLW